MIYTNIGILPPDPECIKYIQSLIPKPGAGQRNDSDLKAIPIAIAVSHYSHGILCDNLPASDAIKVQDVLGLYFGDIYWGSRISMGLFYELKNIFEKTNWKFLRLGFGQPEQFQQVSKGPRGFGLSIYFEALR